MLQKAKKKLSQTVPIQKNVATQLANIEYPEHSLNPESKQEQIILVDNTIVREVNILKGMVQQIGA